MEEAIHTTGIANGEDVNQYNDRKSAGIQEILVRTLAAVGHALDSTYSRQRKSLAKVYSEVIYKLEYLVES